ncbi:MAG: hypothetical protein Unbinned5081contig1001_65 [Prokaryotic dsDNA virus sp.]|nr:MAG: hypothetical protein Unbinned5081contig1001_65 [Prokaryotic dsDNA virus sp.]|tara:strand:+ start:2430 stop:5060 length:2631 start_codon:yes stop_codon:yes gene_type:complete
MSFEDCVNSATGDGHGSKGQGEEATRLWKERAAMYKRQGYQPHIAEVMAAEDVKVALKKQAGEIRHVYLSRIANMNMIRKATSDASDEAIKNFATRSMKILDMKSRRLKRHFDAKMSEYLATNYRDMLGRPTDPATMLDMVRELYGENTGNVNAKAMAEAVDYAKEDMRLMFNEAGGIIGKLENRGLKHVHNRIQVMNAGIGRLAKERGVSTARIKAEMAIPGDKGAAARQAVFENSFDQWFEDIGPKLDWTRIEDFLTGKPFQAEGGSAPDIETQRSLLKEMFDSIVYGDRAKDPSYGKNSGTALYRQHAKSRVLHFKSADDWIAYNKVYGTGDPHKSLMAEVHQLSKDIVAMREFGPNPDLGLDFQGQNILAEAKKRGLTPSSMESDINHAKRMMKIERGGNIPSGYWGAMRANFFSTTRKVLSANLLERAVVASLSDNAFIRGAVRSIGGNPNNALSNQVRIIAELAKSKALSTEEMMQWRWITDTHADPGVSAARFEAEMPAAEWSERFSTGVMRASGLTSVTDAGRFNATQIWAGQLGTQIGRKFEDIDPALLTRLKEVGVTEGDWIEFSRADLAFEPEKGVRFLNDLYWREATDLPDNVADDIFLKFGAAAETFVEEGVATQSLYARAMIDPAGTNLEPGSLIYELLKSGGMFKSFVMAVTANQFNTIKRLPTTEARVAHGAKVIAESTMIAALALQIGEIANGNDPMPMDTTDFWARAVMKGGGLAILGDLFATGETKWGGGFPGYIAGPMVQLTGDTWDLTVSNAVEAGRSILTGEEMKTGFAKEARRYVGRYAIPKDFVFLGPAVDRLLLDQFQMVLDPESINALEKASKLRENRNGNGSWWMPGSPVPNRAPNLVPEFNPENFFQP